MDRDESGGGALFGLVRERVVPLALGKYTWPRIFQDLPPPSLAPFAVMPFSPPSVISLSPIDRHDIVQPTRP